MLAEKRSREYLTAWATLQDTGRRTLVDWLSTQTDVYNTWTELVHAGSQNPLPRITIGANRVEFKFSPPLDNSQKPLSPDAPNDFLILITELRLV